MDPQSQQPQPVQPPMPPQTPPPEPAPATEPVANTVQQVPSSATFAPAASPKPTAQEGQAFPQQAPATLSNSPAPITSRRKKFKEMTHEDISKRIDLLGKILVGLSVFAIIHAVATTALATGSFSPTDPGSYGGNIFLAFIQALIGAGLIKRNIVAFYAFRVIGILVLISLLLVLAFVPFAVIGLVALASNTGSMDGLYLLLIISMVLALVLYGSAYFFWIYGLFLTNQPKAKELFMKRPPSPQQPVQTVSPPHVQ
jgi:hypothetical protein